GRDRELAATERHDHRAGARAARRGRGDLREPPQRRCRRRRAVPEIRQRGDPARWLRQLPVLPRDPRLPAAGTARRRSAGGVGGAAETLLVDRQGASTNLKPLVEMLIDAGCEVRGDDAVQRTDARVKPASDEDWDTEYEDAIITAKVVDGIDEAIAHIHNHGSHHTDAIVTEDQTAARKFLNEVDSAIVLHNASTQFADGGEFGFGAEIGIATGTFHARGPVGAEQLTSFKYRVHGTGQTRP